MNPLSRWRTVAFRYGAALMVVLAAAVLRWALQPVMGVSSPYITLYLAITVAAAMGGFGPGVVATLVGGLMAIGVADLSIERLHFGTVAEQVRLAIYLASGLAISLIAGGMHMARRRAAAEAEHLRRVSEELRQANERLLETDRSRNSFLAVLSHELRNPLMPIKHSLYILERAPGESDAARRARAIIGRQVDQMSRLVNDLLDVTRISRDKLKLQRERFDLREVVGRTLDDHRTVFDARGVRLDQQLPQQEIWVHGDPSRLSQVVGNLLHNAAKFTPGGGSVHVSLEQQDQEAVLRVRDNGVGVPADLLDRVFDPFIQAEQKLDRGAGGLGLGLTLVKRLVALHGGAVQVRSEGEGRGAEFIVTLPVDTLGTFTLPAQPAASGLPRRRVLVVEDNVDSADTLSILLKTRGHEVDVCYSGDQALAKAKGFHPDTVLCDIGLPGMDGYQVARALRDDSALRRARLVALTGYASSEDRDKALAAGFDKHLVKPPSVEELEQVLSD